MRGFGFPGCALRRHRSDLDEAKSKRFPGRQGHAVLVETGGEADGIWEIDAEDGCRMSRFDSWNQRQEMIAGNESRNGAPSPGLTRRAVA